MQIAKWGKSLAVRIPADVARELGLKEGDNVELRAAKSGGIEIVSDAQRRAEAIRRLRKFRGTRPDDFKFDRDEINARGTVIAGKWWHPA